MGVSSIGIVFTYTGISIIKRHKCPETFIFEKDDLFTTNFQFGACYYYGVQ